MTKQIPSERELDLLKVMWRLGEAKVRDIHDALCPDGECAFTTVQTLVRIMQQKGFVKKRSEGRTDFYTPVYTLEDATSRFVEKLFDGPLTDLSSACSPRRTFQRTKCVRWKK